MRSGWRSLQGGCSAYKPLGLFSRPPRPHLGPPASPLVDSAQNPQGREMGRNVRAHPEPPLGTPLSPEIMVRLVLLSCTCPLYAGNNFSREPQTAPTNCRN